MKCYYFVVVVVVVIGVVAVLFCCCCCFVLLCVTVDVVALLGFYHSSLTFKDSVKVNTMSTAWVYLKK